VIELQANGEGSDVASSRWLHM